MQSPFHFPTRAVRHSRLWRALPLTLVICGAMAVATYCVSWYFQAAYAKSGMERLLADVNAKGVLVSYSAIETTGFPFDVVVRIVQPKFSARVDNLLRAGTTPAATLHAQDWQNTLAKLPDWVEETAFAGSINLGANLFSDRYTLFVEGPATQVSVIGGNREVLLIQPRGPLSCTLELTRRGGWLSGAWDLARISALSLEEILRDFRALECQTPGYAITDDASKEAMYSSGAQAFRLLNAPEPGGQRTTQLALKLADYEFSPRMNATLSRYAALFTDAAGTLPSLDFAAYGKQNVDIEMTMHGPADQRTFTDEVPFSITIPRFTISNALYSTASNLQLENRIAGEARSVAFIVNSNSSFSKAYDKYLLDYGRIIIRQLRDSTDPEMADIKRSLLGLSVDQTAEVLEPVIPKLHSFGSIGVQINANVEGDKLLHKGNLILSNFDINTTPYGISMQGSTPLPAPGEPFSPASTFTLSCRNCLMLVDDAGRYAQRLQQALTTLDPEMADQPTYMSAQLTQGIKHFLTTLGEKHQDAATGDSLTFTLSADSAGTLNLNGRPPAEVMQLYGEHIAPHIPVQHGDAQQDPLAGSY